MKRTGNLWPRICSRDALMAAYQRASLGKRSHRACFEFSRALGANIDALLQELEDGTYRPRPLNRFWVRDGKKPRLIEAPAFRDLVVQHAAYAAISPGLERRYIATNFACRPGKGTHSAADWLQKTMRRACPGSWVLHVDVRKFFYSIDRCTLQALLSRHIKCERTLSLIALFAQRPEPTGVPIGNLLSQTFANVYLNSLDHFCKRSLKIGHYARYMDDSIMIAPDRATGLQWLAAIGQHLAALGLEISHHSLQPIGRGVDFVGYRTWTYCRLVRKSLLSAIRRDARKAAISPLISRLAAALRTRSIHHIIAHLKDRHHALFVRLPNRHRLCDHARPALAHH
jgi:retron-type reverse transcriptase